MVGLVIVSHSRQISDGLKRMADNMCPEDVPIVSAGGMDDPEDPLGTDAIRILKAIQEVMSSDGVLVFWDLGAAKLNSEMAIDFLEDEERAKVQLCDAPLVEGVLAATLQSAAGSDIERVMAEAQTAYEPPSGTSGPSGTTENAAESAQSATALVESYAVTNPMGLHARPAARFVNEMNKFESDVWLQNLTTGSGFVNAKSINKVVTLEVRHGNRIRVSADGADAPEVHAAFRRLLAERFGEGRQAASMDASAEEHLATAGVVNANASTSANTYATDLSAQRPRLLRGTAISEGYAEGPCHFVPGELVETEKRGIDDPKRELARLEEAILLARNELSKIAEQSRSRVDDWEAQIFEAQQLHLNDPEITDQVRKLILERHVNAEWAWYRTVADIVSSYHALEDEIVRARGDDLADVGIRVLSLLKAEKGDADYPSVPFILCTDRLRPSYIPLMDVERVKGVCTVGGSRTSHAGILASSLGIPVVFGVGKQLTEAGEGQEFLLSGTEGWVNIEPTEKDRRSFRIARSAWEHRREQTNRIKREPAVTRDGLRVRAAGNVFDVAHLPALIESGADEVGLFRTEFLYMNRTKAPTLSEQLATYKRAVDLLDGRSLVIRTMDIGGDKAVPYLQHDVEANPNLGWRGIRYGLSNTEVLATQVEAILRAAAYGPIRLMFPMISTVEEVVAARDLVEDIKSRLSKENVPFGTGIEIGIMIEVPAASEIADKLAGHVDFFSIGTNDLTQYIMAADRDNCRVQHLVDPLHPGVLRAIARTIRAGHKAGIWVGMCGEMAGDRLAMPVLLGLGLDEFSMDPSRVPEFKLELSRLSATECQRHAEHVLNLDKAGEVSVYLKTQLLQKRSKKINNRRQSR